MFVALESLVLKLFYQNLHISKAQSPTPARWLSAHSKWFVQSLFHGCFGKASFGNWNTAFLRLHQTANSIVKVKASTDPITSNGSGITVCLAGSLCWEASTPEINTTRSAWIKTNLPSWPEGWRMQHGGEVSKGSTFSTVDCVCERPQTWREIHLCKDLPQSMLGWFLLLGTKDATAPSRKRERCSSTSNFVHSTWHILMMFSPGSLVLSLNLLCSKGYTLKDHLPSSGGSNFLKQTQVHPDSIDSYMGVSENRGKTPQIIHFNSIFHYKPSILGKNPPIFGNISLNPAVHQW